MHEVLGFHSMGHIYIYIVHNYNGIEGLQRLIHLFQSDLAEPGYIQYHLIYTNCTCIFAAREMLASLALSNPAWM